MFENLPIAAALVVLGIVLYTIQWQLTTGRQRRAIIRERGCLPVKQLPSRDPILGYDTFRTVINAFKERKGLELLTSRFAELGNTYKLYSLGRSFITTIEPENLKTIQALRFKDWSLGGNRMKFFGPFLGRGIFTTDGAEWQHSREMLRPNFVRSQVGDVATFEHHFQHLVAAVPTDGSTVDLQDLFFRLTIDSATEFLFGESTNCLAPGLSTVSASKFAEAFNQGQEAMTLNTRYGLFSFVLSQSKFKKDTKFVHDFIDGYVRDGLAKRSRLLAEKPKDSERYVFINELVRETDNAERIRSELLNILLAGRDTTASLLSNAWWVMSRRPDIWSKLRADVDSLDGQRPSFEQLKELKYLRAVLNESLRLHPVVPLNSRQAVVDTVLPLGGGPDGKAPLFIAKGEQVGWNLYAMHRRKDFYGEDAEEFRPERWLGKDGLRPGWEYLPFNGGPRICLGQQFALTEASYTTVRLMQEFKDIQSRDSEPWREYMTLTCVGGGGCKVSLTPF